MGLQGAAAGYFGMFMGTRTDSGRSVVGRCILKVQARKMEQKRQILQVQTLRENLTGVGGCSTLQANKPVFTEMTRQLRWDSQTKRH